MATSNTVIGENQPTTPGGNSDNSTHLEEEKSQSVSESPSPPTPNNKAAAGENESADGGGRLQILTFFLSISLLQIGQPFTNH